MFERRLTILKLHIPSGEYYDSEKSQFVELEAVTLELEHSLASLARWESKWEKPFLSKEDKTNAETISYIEMMCLSDFDPDYFGRITNEHIAQVGEYISAKMTATWFAEDATPAKPGQREQVTTAEVIYFWMINFNVPPEYQHWHFNRLMTLIQVCNENNKKPSKKGINKQTISERDRLNESRKAQHKTTG